MRQQITPLHLGGRDAGTLNVAVSWSDASPSMLAAIGARPHQESEASNDTIAVWVIVGFLLIVALSATALGAAVVRLRRLRRRCEELQLHLENASRTAEQQVSERMRVLVKSNERLTAEVRELRRTESRLRHAQLTLEETTQKYARLSLMDPLTSLANRRKFDEVLELEWRRGIRNQMPISLVLVDVDYFKLFNDTYGHGAGDDCLREIAEVIAASARRPGDLAARIGGEEFTVLLCDASAEGAMSVACQIQASIEQLAIAHETTKVFDTDIVSVSIGIASMLPDATIGPTVLLYHADEALYSAKQDGRNCIRGYDDDRTKGRRSQSAMRAAPSIRAHESFGRNTR